MATPEELAQRQEVATIQVETAAHILDRVGNGTKTETVPTTNGPVPSVAKFFEDNQVEITAAAGATGRFCGVSATAPTTRLDGSALREADEYHNSVDKLRYSWSGTAWVALNSSVQQLETELSSPLGPEKVGRSAFFVDSIQELIGLPQKLGSKAVVASYHSGGAVGGGTFVFDGSKLRSSHDGMNIFSPTVPFTWADLGASYLYGAGETLPNIGGCWVRQSANSDCFNAGAIVSTNITMSIRKAIQVTGGAAILKGNFTVTPNIITLSSYQFVRGAGKGLTVLTLTADTTGWGMRSRGNYNKFSDLTLQAYQGATLFSGSLLQAEHDDFVTYKQEFENLYLKGVAGSSTGRGLHCYSDSDTGKGVTFPLGDNIDGWNLQSVLYFSKILSGYVDSGTFTRIRGSICKFVVDMGVKGAGSTTFKDVHGRYDSGVTEGLIRVRGTRIGIKDCLLYDFASPYIFVEPESEGTMISNTVLVSQGSAVQDKGWGTTFIGPPTSCTPESSGGAGYGWLEQHDNCLGFDVARNWNVVKTGTSSAVYTGPVSALGPMMLLTAAGAAGSSAQLDYGTVFACNPYQQTKIYGFFWIPQASNLGRFEVGLFNASGLATISLVADVTVNPNFFFLIKQPGQADVIKDTGEPVGTKRHSFGITRTGNGGLTLHFDCLAKFVDVPYTVEALAQPRYKMTNLTATTASVYLFALTLRTTSDTYVTNWTGAL